ncbi:hypothetical protein [Paenibacillus sp. WLX2291]|uniref:hypothetical protein n=1 Tax=Paenibacillus sp. WLX2291 TaxID=3296934 RepID=UPI0039845109
MMKININLEQQHTDENTVAVPEQQQEMIIRSPLSPLLFPLRLIATGLQALVSMLGWGVVGTGYAFATLLLLVGIFFNVIGLLNLGNGIGATLFAFGLCFIPMGLASPLFYWSQSLKGKLTVFGKARKGMLQREGNVQG